MDKKINKDTAYLGSNATAAWADAESEEKDTKINIPSEEAVKDAKEWIEENEK